ncbi:MAG: hypothetical protein KAG89_02365 [Fulvimarina manganoxydans]|uniref:hypothetical protein n=1 Tax=Fulvimarina manganoxydans TaxID=937218 RepID=UPI0023526677|nr:hypothetical protein [Fulvimarina manganoxydans]MCK5930988.1 hypothetical protein [Fulvimarina manganoxydans]
MDRGSQLLFGEPPAEFRKPDGVDEAQGRVGMDIGQIGKMRRFDDQLVHAESPFRGAPASPALASNSDSMSEEARHSTEESEQGKRNPSPPEREGSIS